MLSPQSLALALCIASLPCLSSCTRSDAARAENAKVVIADHQPVIAPPQPAGRQKHSFGYLASALPERLFLQGPTLKDLKLFAKKLTTDEQAIACLEQEAEGLNSILLATIAREDYFAVHPASLWILQTERSTEDLRTCLSEGRDAQEPLHANLDYFGGRFHRRLSDKLVIVRDGPFYLIGSRSEIDAALKRPMAAEYPLKNGVVGQLQFAAKSNEKAKLRLVEGSRLRLSFQITEEGVLIETRFEEQKLQTDDIIKSSKRTSIESDSKDDAAPVALEDEITDGEALADQAQLTLAFKEDLRDFYRAHAEQFSWLLEDENATPGSGITLNSLSDSVMAGKVHAPDEGLYLEFMLPKKPFVAALGQLVNEQLGAFSLTGNTTAPNKASAEVKTAASSD